jgi:hypothetical protein
MDVRGTLDLCLVIECIDQSCCDVSENLYIGQVCVVEARCVHPMYTRIEDLIHFDHAVPAALGSSVELRSLGIGRK